MSDDAQATDAATDTDAADADNALADAADRAQQQQGSPGQTDASTQNDGTDWQKEAAKWKALARKHEQSAKDLKPLADKARKIEEDQKTETQKLQDQLDAAQVELATYRVGSIRQEAVAKAGLPPEMHQFLTAVEPDAALEQAKLLASKMAPGHSPAGDFKQGTRTQQTAKQMDGNQLLRAMAGY